MKGIPTNGRIQKSLDGATSKGYNGQGPASTEPISPGVERLCQAIARIVRRLQQQGQTS